MLICRKLVSIIRRLKKPCHRAAPQRAGAQVKLAENRGSKLKATRYHSLKPGAFNVVGSTSACTHRLTQAKLLTLSSALNAPRCRGVQVDISETRTLKGMCFQLVETTALSSQGQPDVFNLHRLTAAAEPYKVRKVLGDAAHHDRMVSARRLRRWQIRRAAAPA